MAIGMALIGAGILWATRLPMDGEFWDLLGPFMITGIGTAFAFIPVSIAALDGVAEDEAGLASGLIYTSQEFGGALGIAIASSVAASHSKTLLQGGDGVPASLTGGFHSAFWVLGVLALLALPVIAALVRGEELTTPEMEATPPERRPSPAPIDRQPSAR